MRSATTGAGGNDGAAWDKSSIARSLVRWLTSAKAPPIGECVRSAVRGENSTARTVAEPGAPNPVPTSSGPEFVVTCSQPRAIEVREDQPMNNSVAQLMVDALRASDVDTLFCVPGGQNDDFFNALVDAPDIRPIVTRHEQGAAYMAMGAAQVTGRPAACCVVPGPGMLNAAGALTSAYWGYARVLTIVGQIHSKLRGRNVGTLHDLPDQTAILSQLTKHTAVADKPETAAAVIQEATDAVHSGLPRPVSIEVPVDVWGRQANGSIAAPQVTMPVADPEAIARAATQIADAKNPLIVVGSGAYGAADAVTMLAELIQAPVTTRRMGHGVVPTSHPLFIPITSAYDIWPTVDLVVGIGSRIEWPLGTWGTDDNIAVIQINVDPTELDRYGITDVEIHADANDGCRALLAELGDIDRPDQSEACAALRASFGDQTAYLVPQREYTAAIRDVLPDNGVLVEDVTQIGFASHLFYDHLAPGTFLSSGAAGTLGAGTATAIGASAATDRPIVGIVGDGGFLFTATELATAVQHDIPCNILLFNDGAYGNVRRIQKTRFGADRTIASKLENPDFQQMAEAFGVRAWQTDSPAGLRPALSQAIQHPGPSLVEVLVDEMPDPWPLMRRPPNRGPLAR
jgi:acetolactate synthase-1/2/3 large subunit